MRVSKRRGERVVASHILIRAENTNDDITRALYKIDSAYNLLVDNKIQWCDAVKNMLLLVINLWLTTRGRVAISQICAVEFKRCNLRVYRLM